MSSKDSFQHELFNNCYIIYFMIYFITYFVIYFIIYLSLTILTMAYGVNFIKHMKKVRKTDFDRRILWLRKSFILQAQ